MRHELDTVSRYREESDFLPAALALRDTPLHPAPHVAMAAIMALLVIALAWACFGKVDITATATGKIIPAGYVKNIQAEETAVVRKILVRDGQRVRAGDVLVELDATAATADKAGAQSNLFATRDEIARAHAMLGAAGGKTIPTLTPDPSLGSAQRIAMEQQILAGEYNDYKSNVNKLTSDIAQASASLREAEDQIQKLSQTLPLEKRKEQGYAELLPKGYVSKHDYYSEEQAVIQMTQDLAAQRSRRAQAQAALNGAIRQRETYLSSARRTWLERIHDDEQKAADLEQVLVKARQQQQLKHLSAPVDGIVQGLAIHTMGGVVTPAQILLTVVPDTHSMLVEAIIGNQDIGFVKRGQRAEIKVETFPYTRYGMLDGEVVQVSNSARQDDKLGLIFTAQIRLPQDNMQIDERRIRLTPGMAVTAEIKTGHQRIISYLLSPLIQHASNSFHER